jgi:hypothetical protein
MPAQVIRAAICELFTLTGHYASVTLDQRQLYQHQVPYPVNGMGLWESFRSKPEPDQTRARDGHTYRATLEANT